MVCPIPQGDHKKWQKENDNLNHTTTILYKISQSQQKVLLSVTFKWIVCELKNKENLIIGFFISKIVYSQDECGMFHKAGENLLWIRLEW